MVHLTKDDLRQFKMQLLYEIEQMLNEKIKPALAKINPEWIRSKPSRLSTRIYQEQSRSS